jgi:transposase
MFKIEKPVAAIQTNITSILVSLELSRKTWLLTALLPGNGEKMSKYLVPAGDLPGLFTLFMKLRKRCLEKTGQIWPFLCIQESGLDGFWIHRALEREGVESYVVNASSIATPRRRRRVKTDRIDGEVLLRVLMAHLRGDPRVCSMVRAPSPEAEDRRRVGRERDHLITERIRHTNHIKGLLFSQGVTDYEPLHKDRRARLEELRTGDGGRPLPKHMKAEIVRELERLELVVAHIEAIEDERDALLVQQVSEDKTSPAAMLLGIKGVGVEFANVLVSECFMRTFDNRRQVASYAGLASTPWQSGKVNRDQGVSKAGNPRLRKMLIQMSWLWLRHQPDTTLSQWYQARVAYNGGSGKKRAITALARKLLVALWKYVASGVVIEGVVMKKA